MEQPKYFSTMAEQKQDQGNTRSGNPAGRGTDEGTTQERDTTTSTPRGSDKDQDRERDEQVTGQPGAAYGKPSSMKEPKQGSERDANKPEGRNEGHAGHDQERKDASSQRGLVGSNDDGEQGARNEERTATSGATASHKGDKSDDQRADHKGTERDLN